jgi:hypothetical protein
VDVVRLADRVGVNSLIENQEFVDALLVGPAVIAPLEGVEINECTFDGDAESLFIEVPEGKRVVGVIGLRNVKFRRCEFRNVAVAGTPLSIDRFRQGFNQPPQIVPQG